MYYNPEFNVLLLLVIVMTSALLLADFGSLLELNRRNHHSVLSTVEKNSFTAIMIFLIVLDTVGFLMLELCCKLVFEHAIAVFAVMFLAFWALLIVSYQGYMRLSVEERLRRLPKKR